MKAVKLDTFQDAAFRHLGLATSIHEDASLTSHRFDIPNQPASHNSESARFPQFGVRRDREWQLHHLPPHSSFLCLGSR
jgi:hypothetical protein